MIKVIVSGAAGRMGKRIARLALEDEEVKLIGTLERTGHPRLGEDIGGLIGKEPQGVKITDNLSALARDADCLIEFTSREATLAHLEIMRKAKKAMVIGTTGLSEADLSRIKKAAADIPILSSPNMSVGVNLLFDLADVVTRRLGGEYDVEIVETHHRFKKDSPSGTARKFAEIIARAKGAALDKLAVFGRKGMTGERKTGEIGIHSLRAGDVAGEHTVLFSNLGERIELTHRAHSRDTFAQGALRAAKFVVGKSAGLYGMQEVLKT